MIAHFPSHRNGRLSGIPALSASSRQAFMSFRLIACHGFTVMASAPQPSSQVCILTAGFSVLSYSVSQGFGHPSHGFRPHGRPRHHVHCNMQHSSLLRSSFQHTAGQQLRTSNPLSRKRSHSFFHFIQRSQRLYLYRP